MDRVWIASLCEAIGLPAPETEAALACWDSRADEVTAAAQGCYQSGRVRVLKREVARDAGRGGAFSLCVMLAMARLTKNAYEQRGISDAVFYDTMSDVAVWCENFNRDTGERGLDETNWLINHMRLRIFRLGRLQFERASVRLPVRLPRKKRQALPVRLGEPCLNVHIPQGEPLRPEACLASFEQAGRFMDTYYPDEPFRAFTCCSWLLWPDNRLLLAEDSNIVRFLDLWEIVHAWPDPSQAIERIWGKRERSAARYAANTSLQRAARAHLLAGGQLGEGYGVRLRQN